MKLFLLICKMGKFFLCTLKNMPLIFVETVKNILQKFNNSRIARVELLVKFLKMNNGVHSKYLVLSRRHFFIELLLYSVGEFVYLINDLNVIIFLFRHELENLF